jgi:hypothetical protein
VKISKRQIKRSMRTTPHKAFPVQYHHNLCVYGSIAKVLFEKTAFNTCIYITYQPNNCDVAKYREVSIGESQTKEDFVNGVKEWLDSHEDCIGEIVNLA